MNYRATGITLNPFKPYFNLSNEELKKRGMRRYVADDDGYPCRVSLVNAPLGENILLVNFDHQPAHSPYKSGGPIFVRETDMEPAEFINELPEVAKGRMLSVRAYDDEDLICDADIVIGDELEGLIERFFGDEQVSYLHVHNAKRGCYAFRVDRV